MTIQAQSISPRRDRGRAAGARSLRPRRDAGQGRSPQERPTSDLSAQPVHAIDAFALLDHRTQARSLPHHAAPPGRYLSIETGDGDDVRLIPLDQPIVHIGRGLTADVRLEDTHVSRRHAIIAQRRDGARVLDDRSSHGTHLNGREVTISELADGDVLRLGRVVMRFVEIASPVREQPVRRIPLATIARRQVSPGVT